MWSETLRVNVTVSTGEVDVKWSAYYCSDTGPDPQTPDSFSNTEEKDVAQCYVTAEEYDDEGDVIKLNVTIVNAYPGYHAEITGIVDNIGTIPVKLLSHNMTGVDESAISAYLDIPEDTQIEPGDNSTYTLTIDVLQEASENATYTFEVTLVFAQWNEVSGQ